VVRGFINTHRKELYALKIYLEESEIIEAISSYILETAGVSIDETSFEFTNDLETIFTADIECSEEVDGPDDGEEIPILRSVNG
jgi:hypothetical protein